ncbi:MAG: hypothetical protein ABUL66_04380 [Verrucomicrobiota bacterium]
MLFNAVGPQSALAFPGLGFIRRIPWVGGREHLNHFIANHSGTNLEGWVAFYNAAYNNKLAAVLLDPLTGNSGVAATRQRAANSTEIQLQLAAGESHFEVRVSSLRQLPGIRAV